MKALLGIWHSELVLFVRDKPTFTGLLTLEREDEASQGLLRFQTDTQGGREACKHRADAEETMDYPWVFRSPRPLLDGFARCSLMPVTLGKRDRYDYTAQLPHDHLFPWPCAKDCESYVRSEELTHDLALRRRHAKLVGTSFPTPPGHIVRSMSPATRKALFKAAA